MNAVIARCLIATPYCKQRHVQLSHILMRRLQQHRKLHIFLRKKKMKPMLYAKKALPHVHSVSAIQVVQKELCTHLFSNILISYAATTSICALFLYCMKCPYTRIKTLVPFFFAIAHLFTISFAWSGPEFPLLLRHIPIFFNICNHVVLLFVLKDLIQCFTNMRCVFQNN